MRVIISALQKISATLKYISEILENKNREWFTNQTGKVSFRPEVLPDGNGQFTASVACRTGCSPRDWQVQKYGTYGHWGSARKAMKAARIMARDLALYRYRYTDFSL